MKPSTFRLALTISLLLHAALGLGVLRYFADAPQPLGTASDAITVMEWSEAPVAAPKSSQAPRPAERPGTTTTRPPDSRPATHPTGTGAAVSATADAGTPRGSARGNRILAQIRAQLWRARFYPAQAHQEHLTGDPIVEFSLHPDGRVAQLQLVRSSGHPTLDHAALETVHRAAPFPYWAGAIRIPIEYK